MPGGLLRAIGNPLPNDTWKNVLYGFNCRITLRCGFMMAAEGEFRYGLQAADCGDPHGWHPCDLNR